MTDIRRATMDEVTRKGDKARRLAVMAKVCEDNADSDYAINVEDMKQVVSIRSKATLRNYAKQLGFELIFVARIRDGEAFVIIRSKEGEL